jgi:hypothetical protein
LLLSEDALLRSAAGRNVIFAGGSVVTLCGRECGQAGAAQGFSPCYGGMEGALEVAIGCERFRLLVPLYP